MLPTTIPLPLAVTAPCAKLDENSTSYKLPNPSSCNIIVPAELLSTILTEFCFTRSPYNF